MKKLINHSVTTYIYKNVWRIDVINNKSTYEAWIYHKDYGIKNLMWAVEAEVYGNLADFTALVEKNADDYIRIYKEDHIGG